MPDFDEAIQAYGRDSLRSQKREYASASKDISIDPAVAPGFEHPYSGQQIVEALGRTKWVDASALPTAMAAKYRQQQTNVVEAVENASVWSRAVSWVVRPLAMLGAMCTSAGAAVTALWSWLHGTQVPEWVGVTGGAAVILYGICAVIDLSAYRRNKRQTLTFSGPEQTALMLATADWPTRTALTSYPNRVMLEQEWDQRWPWAPEPGAAAVVWREPHLVAIANLCAQEIRASKAWRSELLDAERLRIDLDATIRGIRFRAARIWRAHANMIADDMVTDEQHYAQREALMARNRELAQAAQEAWVALRDEVQQLLKHREHLAPLDRLVEAIAALELSYSRMPEDALLQLRIDAAGAELDRDNLAQATEGLKTLRADLCARLDFMRAELASPSNTLPMAVSA